MTLSKESTAPLPSPVTERPTAGRAPRRSPAAAKPAASRRRLNTSSGAGPWVD